MTYIARHLESDIKARLFSGKAIIVYGRGSVEKQPCCGTSPKNGQMMSSG